MRRRRSVILSACLAVALCLGSLPLVSQAQDFQSTQRQPLDRVVAVVNGEAIMQSQLENRLAQARSQLAGRDIETPPEQVLREQILERLVIEEIQLQMAREAGISVDDTELNGQVRNIAQRNGMTLEQFADALEADGLSLEVVREEVRREMLLRQLQQRQVGNRVNLNEREVERLMEEEGMEREQARQALFQREASREMEAWIQEIRSRAIVENRLR